MGDVDLPRKIGAAERRMIGELLRRGVQGELHPGLFGNKTQGLPFHVLIVALATLFENRFEGAALARGQLSPRMARRPATSSNVPWDPRKRRGAVVCHEKRQLSVRDSKAVQSSGIVEPARSTWTVRLSSSHPCLKPF